MLTIYKDYKKVNTAGGTAVAIGNFDGVHKGHQKMLVTLCDIAKNLGVPSVVYTFKEHTSNARFMSDGLICTNEEKEKLIENQRVHTLFFEEFSDVSNLTAEEFVKEILIDKFNVKAVVIGEDAKFGKNCSGNAKILTELGKVYGFSVCVVELLKIKDTICSSSEIRKCINGGDFVTANEMLTRPYTVSGTVSGNKKLGRTYGYPTANILKDESFIKIKNGVYATNVIIDKTKYPAITNVGTTSFDNDEKERIESHILDFCSELYGKEIRVEFLYYMRDFMNFTNTEELKLQLDDDKKLRKLGGITK